MNSGANKSIKIISGGQTGVDRGALEAALELGLEAGGWCPPNKQAEDGKIPEHFPLKETPEERSPNAPDIPRSLRTEWNVRDADATLILLPEPDHLDSGTNWTMEVCKRMEKQYFVCNPFEPKSIPQIREQILKRNTRTINVAGPAESVCPGIQAATKTFIKQLYQQY